MVLRLWWQLNCFMLVQSLLKKAPERWAQRCEKMGVFKVPLCCSHHLSFWYDARLMFKQQFNSYLLCFVNILSDYLSLIPFVRPILLIFFRFVPFPRQHQAVDVSISCSRTSLGFGFEFITKCGEDIMAKLIY